MRTNDCLFCDRSDLILSHCDQGGLAALARTWKECDLKVSDKGVLRKRYVDRPSCIFHLASHQRAPSRERSQSSSGEEGKVYIHGSFSFLSHPCRLPMGPGTKRQWWQEWRLCMGSATWVSTHQDQSSYSHYWELNLTIVDKVPFSAMAPFCGRTCPPPWL